jgi:Na+-transporting NADH:ubiquinone oxidoreductase subunit C
MKSRLISICYMFFLTLFFTSVVSVVKAVNEDRIRLNEEVKLKRVVLDVLRIPLPEGVPETSAVNDLFAERVKVKEREGRLFYVGYDVAGERPAAIAFAVGGPGFWGPIEAMVAVDDSSSTVIGVNFFRHTETPGLGARMTEPLFRDQFRGLSLKGKGAASGEPLFRLVPAGTGSAAEELDAITGATQTSEAIERFLNRELKRFVDGRANWEREGT